MPLPTPRKGEPTKDFLERCMGDSEAVKTFSDPKQRYAVCERQSKMRAATEASRADDEPAHELPATISMSASVQVEAPKEESK